MTVKPSSYPRWADDDSAGIVNPNEDKKDKGFISGEEPPAEYFNWFMNLTYQWIRYLEFPNTKITIPGIAFNAGSVSLTYGTFGYASMTGSASAGAAAVALPLGWYIREAHASVDHQGTGSSTIQLSLVVLDQTTGNSSVLAQSTASSDFDIQELSIEGLSIEVE